MTLRWLEKDYGVSRLAHPSELFLPLIVFELFYNSYCSKLIGTQKVPAYRSANPSFAIGMWRAMPSPPSTPLPAP